MAMNIYHAFNKLLDFYDYLQMNGFISFDINPKSMHRSRIDFFSNDKLSFEVRYGDKISIKEIEVNLKKIRNKKLMPLIEIFYGLGEFSQCKFRRIILLEDNILYLECADKCTKFKYKSSDRFSDEDIIRFVLEDGRIDVDFENIGYEIDEFLKI